MNARSTLLQWLSKSELQRALDGLDLLCRHHADPQRSAEVALLSGRHHHLLEQQRDGTIHQADYLTERARISKAVMDVVQHLPADWSAEPLAQVPPAPAPPAATPPPKSFLEKWGLIIGIVAGIAGITGLTLKDVLFPKKTEPAATQQTTGATQAPSTSQPAGQVPQKKAEQPADKQPKKSPQTSSSSPSVSTPPQTTVAKPSATTEAEKPKSAPTQPTETAATGKFRSYAPTKIIEGMERGKVDGEHAYRNLMTNKILCCYDDAEDFNGGKAWVSRRGKYFYIDKSGKEVEE